MKNPQQKIKLPIPLWLIWATALGFVLAGLGSFGVLDNNEGLYADISREMLLSRDWRHWIIPYLNGLPYMEKPPLLYWLTALSFAVFGVSEWSARLVPALSSLACVAMLLQFGRIVGRPRAGRLAALMFASSIGVVAMSRLLMFDMLLTALLTAALMCAYRHLHDGNKKWLRMAYACLALASLTKGSVALVLFGLIVLSFMLVSRRLRDWRTWFEPYATLIFFAIAAPWHVMASLTEPFFAWFYFYNEHVLRFLGRREPRDYYSGPWWYYLPRMLAYLFPWSALLSGLYFSARKPLNTRQLPLQRFLWLAWLLPLLFFSISSAKANYYLIAAVPFAAFHLATAIENRGFLSGIGAAAPGLLIAVIAAGLCIWVTTGFENTRPNVVILGLKIPAFALVVLTGLAILALGSAYCAWRNTGVGILTYLVLSAWLTATLKVTLVEIEPLVSTRSLATYIQRTLPDREVYLYRDFEDVSSLSFYLKKSLAVVESRSNDLFWGNRLRENNIVISADQFNARLPGKPVAIVVADRQIESFRESIFFQRFKTVKRIGGISVFVN
ncbi:ArnT family glycosyltransferase [Collimonas silvisoli]|uniref:ArnT family glycosyltransferase n=1 Tax=Collimonas silvisoli TaxID=2825884 RepID=UPI001B8BD23F|nr:glycosyltransferase family 39 protein [Collimonas silvisoli]